MSIMPPGGIETAQRILKMSLPNTCKRTRYSSGGKDAGGHQLPPSEDVIEEPCRLAPGNLATEEWIAGQQMSNVPYDITFRVEADILSGDEIECEGRRFEVLGVPVREAWAVSKKVACTELNMGMSE